MRLLVHLCVALSYALLTTLASCNDDEKEEVNRGVLQLNEITVGDVTLSLLNESLNSSIPTGEPFKINFSEPVDVALAETAVTVKELSSNSEVPKAVGFENENRTIVLTVALDANKSFKLNLSQDLRGANGQKFPGLQIGFSTVPGTVVVSKIVNDGIDVTAINRIKDVSLEGTSFEVTFSKSLNPSTVTTDNIRLLGQSSVPIDLALANENRTVVITPTIPLADLRRYRIQITSAVEGMNEEVFETFNRFFYTTLSSNSDFPMIGDDELLTLVQQQTFKYFYDFAHPASGMARERNSSGNLVTSGGSGFGIMALVVGIERNFISRAEGLQHFDKILDFLEGADRFHGAWSHWIDGNNGNVIPFSPNDNGGDLVETAFLVQGLITFRQYLNENDPAEQALIDRVNALWEGVEWDWYTRGGEDVLYWHWSPDKEWIMNHQIRGHNETLITYVLAASSPTHSIDASTYHNGYARNGALKNGKSFYNITLPLGEDYGGPLFFSHYSFLGLDPRNLSDEYANYWTQNVNHSRINHAYVVANPKKWVGYSDENWGLTASDNHEGYSAHSPTNDLGIITPTAALSSFPYTPEESLKAMRFFYYSIGDRLWGPYGFYDAFNITEGWVADSYLAIDQGPIVVMIENHRTGLLWDLFMSAPEVQAGLTKLGFNY